MTDAAAILWPIAALGLGAMTAKCAALWIQARAMAIQRADERAEREKGILPQFEALKKEVEAMRLEQKTAIASLRGRG